MTPLATFAHDFEGEPLITLSYQGRPAWIARHIGARIGHGRDGKRLPNKILTDWSDEFIEGRDYAFLTGDELAAFKQMTGDGHVSSKVNRGLLILFESGLWLVLAKTNRPIGRRLRRFLADEVLPRIARQQGPEPERVTRTGVALVLVAGGKPSLAERRESRLAQQAISRARWVDLCDRRLKVGALHRVVDRCQGTPAMPEEVAVALEVAAAEIALGAPLPALDPDLSAWRAAVRAVVERALEAEPPSPPEAA